MRIISIIQQYSTKQSEKLSERHYVFVFIKYLQFKRELYQQLCYFEENRLFTVFFFFPDYKKLNLVFLSIKPNKLLSGGVSIRKKAQIGAQEDEELKPGVGMC